ncbi:MAG TPA: helix-turn-helix domain-containing protein [Candidatus Paceibacterota bacterium]|jgi:DNA-binding winged helix-turn-helix (wHTH) protein|nr:helix-turn-helix domain-containing protein [Candidatus Paceibacterota bacterium]
MSEFYDLNRTTRSTGRARSRAAQIKKIVADLECSVAALERDIAAEERNTGVMDVSHVNYSFLAKAARGRRARLLRTIQDLQPHLLAAESEIEGLEDTGSSTQESHATQRDNDLAALPRTLHLTTIEYGLLECFFLGRGAVMSRESLAIHVWGENGHPRNMRRIYRIVSRLRSKLRTTPITIETVRSRGYQMHAPGMHATDLDGQNGS